MKNSTPLWLHNEGVIEEFSHRDHGTSRIVSAFVVVDCDDESDLQETLAANLDRVEQSRDVDLPFAFQHPDSGSVRQLCNHQPHNDPANRERDVLVKITDL